MKPASLLLVVLVGTTTALPPPAIAAPPDEAEQLIARGIELRKKGQHFDAEAYFQRAYRLGRTPRASAQLGLVEHALSRWVEAERHLGEALAADRDPWIKKVRATLESSLATVRANVGQIEIRGEPAGAEILLNGALVGKLPLAAPVHASKGYADVEARAAGYATSKRTVTVEGGGFQPLFIALVKDDPVPAPRAAGTPATDRNLDLTSSGSGDGNPAAPRTGPRPLQITGIAVAAAGLVAVGLGVKSSMDVSSLQSSYDAEKVAARRAALRSEGEATSQRQWLWYGAGGAALVGGALLYFLGDAAESPRSGPVSLQPLLSPVATGMAATLSF
jgi:tetratricopeptide (TPR) repeat protein